MNPNLKKRIESINKGIIPEGYKKTKVGIVPVEWMEKTFGNLIDEYKNKSVIENEDTLLSCAINGIFLNSELFSHQRGSSNKGYLKIDYGTLILSTQNLHLGNANVNLKFKSGIVSPAYKTYKIKNCDVKYFSFWIKREETKSFFYNATTTGASQCRRNIEWDSLYEQIVVLPPLPEQQKIAEILSTQDKLIELQEKKIEQLKELKKAYLQKMFPQKGSKYPELRFKGFTDPWEQREVKELCSISTGKSNTQDKIDDGEYPFYVRSPIVERSNKYLYDEEAVLTVGDGVGTGKVFHYVNGKYDLHQRCYRMYGFSDELDAKYFYHTFSLLFYKRVMAMTAKTSVDSVRLEMISDMEIPTPSIDEQLKIGQLFTNIDSLITLHQRKSEQEKQKKKALMQLLLTGKVRCK